jgi:hypothetical protein
MVSALKNILKNIRQNEKKLYDEKNMGNIFPFPWPVIVDETVYKLCGFMAYCDREGISPDSEPWPICFAVSGIGIKMWLARGGSGVCGNSVFGAEPTNDRFTLTSCTIWAPD